MTKRLLTNPVQPGVEAETREGILSRRLQRQRSSTGPGVSLFPVAATAGHDFYAAFPPQRPSLRHQVVEVGGVLKRIYYLSMEPQSGCLKDNFIDYGRCKRWDKMSLKAETAQKTELKRPSGLLMVRTRSRR